MAPEAARIGLEQGRRAALQASHLRNIDENALADMLDIGQKVSLTVFATELCSRMKAAGIPDAVTTKFSPHLDDILHSLHANRVITSG